MTGVRQGQTEVDLVLVIAKSILESQGVIRSLVSVARKVTCICETASDIVLEAVYIKDTFRRPALTRVQVVLLTEHERLVAFPDQVERSGTVVQ